LEAGWASGRVWTDEENLALTGIRSLDRPARSESLYRLSRKYYAGRLMLSSLSLFKIYIDKEYKERNAENIRGIKPTITN
jgi:hypothetical protein